MEDDFDEAGDGSSGDEEDDGDSIVSGSDVSYSGSEANEYQYDDFLVPDHESIGQASEASDEASDDEDSDDEDSDDEDSDDSDDEDSDVEMAAPGVAAAGVTDAAESEQTVVIDLTGTNEE
jgi:ribonuclease E